MAVEVGGGEAMALKVGRNPIISGICKLNLTHLI